ncbi:MAG: diaminopimelate decarboxylase [Herpetosiphonaceae bacterium]|nr:diaminopimelate decarboxylase [Herpetosiphonaceae bacterium]
MELEPQLWPATARLAADGSLQVGGCSIPDLAHNYRTPLYVLDLLTLQRTARRYRTAFAEHYPATTSIHYASKALLNTAVAQLMADAGLGLDCVSLGEVEIALRAGLDPQELHLHGNAKPAHELQQALMHGVGRIVVDSLDELRLLRELTRERATPYPIWLRLNPGIDVHTHAHIQTGQLDSKFGLPIINGMARAALDLLRNVPELKLVGIHAHLGSQITELDVLQLGVERLLAFAAQVRDDFGWTIEDLSPGGGLAVAYQAGDPTVSIEVYAQALSQAVVAQCEQVGLALPRLVIEPGRSLIARAMVAVYEVLAVKAIPGVRTYAAVDGGMGDNLRPALYDAHYTVRRASARLDQELQPATVVGRYCESGDVLVRDASLPPLVAGDLLALAQAGAYTLSMASNYNQVARPALVLVADGVSYLLQRRETVDDLVSRDRELPWKVRSQHAT